MKQNKLMTRVCNVLMNIAGSFLLAFAVCAFVDPFDMIVGGATGISLVLHRTVGTSISVVALIINVAVLIPGWIFGGKKLVLGSVLSSLVYPFAVAIFERIPNIDAFADNALLAAICGGVCAGAGIGIVMRSGGSTGGLDIPVLLIAKRIHLPVNTLMNLTDTVIMLAQLPFSGVTSILYGLIYTFVMAQALGAVLVFGEDRVRMTVISESFEAIRTALTEQDFGVTMVYAEGGFTGEEIKKIETVMVTGRLRQAQKLVTETDPTAFVTVEKVKDVRGRGYTMERVWLEKEEAEYGRD